MYFLISMPYSLAKALALDVAFILSSSVIVSSLDSVLFFASKSAIDFIEWRIPNKSYIKKGDIICALETAKSAVDIMAENEKTKKYVTDNFGWDKIIKKYMEQYSELLNHNQQASNRKTGKKTRWKKINFGDVIFFQKKIKLFLCAKSDFFFIP